MATKKKAAQDTLLALVLDGSGSMGHLRASTVEGVNGLFAEQREMEGRILFSMTVFNTGFDVRFVAQDLREVPDHGAMNAVNEDCTLWRCIACGRGCYLELT